MQSEPSRVLLIENDGGMIRAVKSAIEDDPQLRFVGYLTGRTNLEALLDAHAPDVALVDIVLMRPGEGMHVRCDVEDFEEGIWIIGRIQELSPHTKVIGFSNYLIAYPALVKRAMQCGAEAVIAKQTAPADWAAWCTWLRSQIHAVLDGWWRPSPEVARLFSDEEEENRRLAPDDPLPLTMRQMEVLRLLAEGKPDAAIASALCIEEGAVRGHISNIKKRLGRRHRWQVVDDARRHGLGGGRSAASHA